MVKVEILPSKNLKITTTKKVLDVCDLFDELGDSDVVTAFEVKENYIACFGNLYFFGDKEFEFLKTKKEVVLDYVGTVKELANEEFINWYHGDTE